MTVKAKCVQCNRCPEWVDLPEHCFKPIIAECAYCLMEAGLPDNLGEDYRNGICERHIIAFKHNARMFRAEARQRAEGDMIDLEAEQDLISNEIEERQRRDYPRGRQCLR